MQALLSLTGITCQAAIGTTPTRLSACMRHLHSTAWAHVASATTVSNSSGLNKGYYELASGAEIVSYFDKVMQERFLPSSRVQYFPMCEYLGDGRFVSRLSGAMQQVAVGKKLVDATFLDTQVPRPTVRPFKLRKVSHSRPPICCLFMHPDINDALSWVAAKQQWMFASGYCRWAPDQRASDGSFHKMPGCETAI